MHRDVDSRSLGPIRNPGLDIASETGMHLENHEHTTYEDTVCYEELSHDRRLRYLNSWPQPTRRRVCQSQLPRRMFEDGVQEMYPRFYIRLRFHLPLCFQYPLSLSVPQSILISPTMLLHLSRALNAQVDLPPPRSSSSSSFTQLAPRTLEPPLDLAITHHEQILLVSRNQLYLLIYACIQFVETSHDVPKVQHGSSVCVHLMEDVVAEQLEVVSFACL